MAWPFGGNWDGRTTNDIGTILASLCNAVNERISEFNFLTDTRVNFWVVGGNSKTPTASDFYDSGVSHSVIILNILLIQDAIENLLIGTTFKNKASGNQYEGNIVDNPTSRTTYTLETLLDAGSYGDKWVPYLPTGTSSGALPIWDQMKEALDLILYILWEDFSNNASIGFYSDSVLGPVDITDRRVLTAGNNDAPQDLWDVMMSPLTNEPSPSLITSNISTLRSRGQLEKNTESPRYFLSPGLGIYRVNSTVVYSFENFPIGYLNKIDSGSVFVAAGRENSVNASISFVNEELNTPWLYNVPTDSHDDVAYSETIEIPVISSDFNLDSGNEYLELPNFKIKGRISGNYPIESSDIPWNDLITEWVDEDVTNDAGPVMITNNGSFITPDKWIEFVVDSSGEFTDQD